ncbi:FAD/NAD(P)-binding protein [Fortiea contorta]|uniref:FAD/NAD(P)-binding protein n=1 Tax=Fortiea contorta TaxID=1892405 RepID=UPI000348379F|nr:FAD/NAD(P)-binding protein [Fortiea contorta]
MYSNFLNLTVSPLTIAVIGGGLSGSLVVANLLQNATSPLSVKLIERRQEVGRGVAYSTQVDCHLLNVPAGNMSAYADQPDHFLYWLHRHGYPEVTAKTFVPRQVYGNYIQATLKSAIANAAPGVHFEQIIDEAIAIETTNHSTAIYLSSGECLYVQKAVLALGNLPATLPKPLKAVAHPYVKDAWSPEAIALLHPEDTILLVGTGLTMVDVMVALNQKGFRGKIHAVSRHGLMPVRHQNTVPYPVFLDVETAPKTARELLHLIRQHGRLSQNWRAVIDSLRPLTAQLWSALPLSEQRRFLRHIKAYWEVHRHRIAPEIADVLDAAVESGQLRHYGGRIQSCQPTENELNVTIRERGTGEDIVLRVNRVINCTGANGNYCGAKQPLIASLETQGLIRPHALGIGIDTAANGALIAADGKISQMLYTIGTPRKANLWETTAVPEIRVQAAKLALELLKSSNSLPAVAIQPNWFSNSFTVLQKPAMLFRQLFDPESSTYTYLIADQSTKAAILVDPVLEQVERDLRMLRELGLTLKYCLETHIHADHVTGADKLRQLTDCLAIVPEKAAAVCADRYIRDGNILQLGNLEILAIATPGHSDSHMAYLVNSTHLLTGDALFIRGCGRTDFQNGDPGSLYDAVTQKLFTLPDDTLVYPGHDYQGRTVSTIGEEKTWNPRFAGRDRSEFIELMNNLNLPMPKKILEAVPANQQCGRGLFTLDFQI